MYINFNCPPLPHLVTGGKALFRQGDIHMKRTLFEVFDLILVKKGCLYIEENGTDYTVQKGQFLILPPKRMHRGYDCCEEETLFFWLHFATVGSFSYSEQLNYKNPLRKKIKNSEKREDFFISMPQYGSLTAEQEAEISVCMKSIIDIYVDKRFRKQNSYPYAISQIKRQQMFFTILSILCDNQQQAKAGDLAQNIYDYLLTFYQRPYDLNLLARKFSFHPTYIIRCVKNKFNQTPLQLLLSIRLSKAKDLLASTEKNINDIALAVGFESSAYFAKQFKRISGMTPSEYRRRKLAE